MLDVSGSPFSGSLPAAFLALQRLSILLASDTNISDVHPDVYRLPLRRLHLSRSQLRFPGVNSSSCPRAVRVASLDLSENPWNGINLADVLSCYVGPAAATNGSLTELVLNNMGLVGQLTIGILEGTTVSHLRVDRNAISADTVFTRYGLRAQLDELSVANNPLSNAFSLVSESCAASVSSCSWAMPSMQRK
jgi:hypothetical protein